MKPLSSFACASALGVLWLAACTSATGDGCTGDPLAPGCFDPSPAEPTLVFLGSDDGWRTADLFTMNTDGSNVRQLTMDGLAQSPKWSPDGTEIVFAHWAQNFVTSALKVVSADGSAGRSISDGWRDHEPTWSPAGNRIAFHSTRHNPGGTAALYAMNPDGSDLVRLNERGAVPSWSPDGSRIAFASSATGVPQIHVMNADGTGEARLTPEGQNQGASWSPDGTRIAFAGFRVNSVQNGIYFMNADGSNPVQVTSGSNSDLNPAWSADGRAIFFTGSREGDQGRHVYSVTLADGRIRRIGSAAGEQCCPSFKRPRR